MYETTFSIEGSQQNDVVNGIRKAGYNLVSLNKPIATDTVRAIFGTLSSSVRNRLSSGNAEFIPRGSAVFSKDSDSIGVYDFDIQERQRIDSDPVIVVYEKIPGRTSNLIKEILEDVIKVDIIKSALKSVNDSQFKTSINDLARICNENPNVVYDRCIKFLITSCVSGIRTIDVNEAKLMPKQRIPKQKVAAV